MQLFTSCLTAALLALPLAAAAKPVLYDCDITKRIQKINWLADKMLFVVDDGTVRVVDGHLIRYMDGPVVAKASTKGGKLTVKWLLTGIKDKNGARIPPSQYRAIIDTESGKFAAYVTSSAYSGAKFRGTGACKVHTSVRLPKVFR